MPNMDRKRLIVVSNRLPVSVKKVDGSFQSTVSSGGLVTSLSGLTKSTSFSWFGWPGIEVNDPQDREKVSQSLAEHNAFGIFLDNQLADEHYNQFSNTILWPILHYQSGMIFEDAPWRAYKKVNEIFADAIVKEVTKDTLIWIHDYHLMLLPGLIRERLKKMGWSCAIGFSLHTPFPAADFWRALPVRNEMIEGMLASDLIGFHTEEYKQNFIGTCVNMGAHAGVPNRLQYKDRLVEVGSFVVGIDPEKFNYALQTQEVQHRTRQLENRYRGMTVILGVDRLDYIKGLTQKLKGFDMFLDEHPEMKNKVLLIQVAVPSREDVKEYKDLETEICTIVGKITGKHATPEGSPLLYMHRSVPFDELSALYSVADVCLLTSARDGMNLVSFEYIACQAKRHGVLVLSEFAGASSFTSDASVKFHPANVRELSNAIHRAVTMGAEERKKRHDTLMNIVNTYTSAKWGEQFIDQLSKKT